MNDHIRRPAARSAFASMAGAFLSVSQETPATANLSVERRLDAAPSTPFDAKINQRHLQRGTS